jgi:pimeloyl-ACP methyl ester carboxylesterase
MMTANGIDLYYETHGSGTPLLLIAGLASDSQSWLPVAGALASRCLVITPDNRGAGRTKPGDCPTSVGAMADDCVALIRYLGLPRVNVLGHSMGGFVAQDLAIRHPECVEKLILAGSVPVNSQRNNRLFTDWATCLEAGLDPELWFRSIFYWIFSPRFFENENTLAEALRFAVEYPYPQTAAAFRNQVGAIAQFKETGALPRITARTLVLAATEDLIFPLRECTEFANQLPNAVFRQIDGAGHAMHMEKPQGFIEAVFDFLFKP